MALVMMSKPFRESMEGDHHDDNRQVVKDGGQEEGEDADNDHELTGVGGGDGLGDDVKALQGVHDLHDGQRTEQEEHNLGNVLKGLLNVRLELSRGQVEASADQGPSGDAKDQGS